MRRRFLLKALWVWLAWAGLAVPAWAATGERALTPALSHPMGEGGPLSWPEYRVTRWTVENGLPQNKINALAQTRDGYLWLGTLKGLVRFDGVRFKVFDHNNTPEMTHDSINDLAVDEKDGGLWVGTGGGLLYYRGHQFERYGAEERIGGPVGPLCPAREGGVWFSPHPGQVSLARDRRVQTWKFGPDKDDYTVHQLGEVNSTEMLLLLGVPRSSLAIHRFDFNTKSLVRLNVPASAPPVSPTCLGFLQDPDDSLWLCTGAGIWRGSEGAWTQITSSEASKARPQRVYPMSDGRVWVTQLESGRVSLQQLAGSRLEPFAARDLPAELNVTRVLEDREGDVWVGTTTGLVRLEPKRIRVYSRHDGLRSEDTLAVTKGADGTIWVGAAEGISGIRDGKVESIPVPDTSAKWPRVPVFLADKENALWVVGKWEAAPGVAHFQRGEWERSSAPQGVAGSGEVGAIYEDRKGRIWIGTGTALLCRDGGQWSCYSTNNGLSHRDVRVIHQDRRGDMWFGTYGGGLNRLKDGKFTAYKTNRGERNNRAWWIHEDADGVFWVGSKDGLNRFVPPDLAEIRNKTADGDEGRFFTFTPEQGLGENVVNNIQEDDFGYLWLSGLRGIYRISRQQFNEVAAGQRAAVECVAYGEADGMLNSECNGGDNQPAGCKDDEGRIWFPTAQGVVVIDPKELQRTESPPPVVIEQVKANEQVLFGDGMGSQSKVQGPKSKVGIGLAPDDQPSTSRYQLAPGHGRVLEIHYTANSLVAPERMRFKYRLEGYDADWLEDDQNRRVAFYTNLRPGDYTFHVTACNSHGVWNEPGGQFAFHLAPHFYETWPFYGLCAALFIGTAGGVQAYRLRWQGRTLRAQQAAALAEERARIARDLHDDLGASLTGLALQLEAAQRRGRAESGQLERLAGETRTLAHELRELAWTTNPRCDNTGSLVAFIGELTERFCQAASLQCRLDLPAGESSGEVPARVRHELVAVVKESLANVAKHAGARQVTVGLTMNDGQLNLTVKDDGRGFDPTRASAGSGLQNLRERVEQVGGSLEIKTKPSGGTTVITTVPLHST